MRSQLVVELFGRSKNCGNQCVLKGPIHIVRAERVGEHCCINSLPCEMNSNLALKKDSPSSDLGRACLHQLLRRTDLKAS